MWFSTSRRDIFRFSSAGFEDHPDHCDRHPLRLRRGPDLLGRRLRDIDVEQGQLYDQLHRCRGLLLGAPNP
jgi:hypothetical protein